MKNLLALLFCLIHCSLIGQGALIDHYTFQADDKTTLDFKQRMIEQGVTAVSAIVWQDDLVEVITEGQLSKTDDSPITEETLFPVGALSIYPAVIELHRLVKLGKMSLQDEVSKYVPEIKDARWWKKGELTIEDLLLFRKQLNGPYKPKGYAKGEKMILPAQILASGNQDFPEGVKIKGNRNKSTNSNCTTALLLQVILERHHNSPLAEIIAKQVFQPLGMSRSFYASELSAAQERQTPKGAVKGTALPEGYRRYALQAAMCLWTTPRDYAKLIQHVFQAAAGKDNRLITEATAKRGIEAQLAYHSLIFHSKNGGIYGGGNAKGFYACIDANPKTGLIQVMFANGDVVWPLVNFALGQTASWVALKNSKEKISLVVQPGDEDLRKETEAFLRKYCASENLLFEIISPTAAPLAISATPALLFTSPKGWSVYGGKLNAYKAIENYIRNSRGRPIVPQAYSPAKIIYKQRQQQALGIPLKWTAWKGEAPAEDWKSILIKSLCKKWDANYESGAAFLPNDRRYYLDVHPYAKGDSVFLSMAIFSQYNCIQPIYENFNSPVKGNQVEKNELIEQVTQQALAIIEDYLGNKKYGEALLPIDQAISKTSFNPVTFLESTNDEEIGTSDFSLDGNWGSPQAALKSQPILQFNFPSPLDRYAGEVRKLSGSMQLNQGTIQGNFTADLKTLTMGSKDFDAKVLKDYLVVKKFPTAQFSFAAVPFTYSWDSNTPVNIPGTMRLLGRELPIEAAAQLNPRSESNSIYVQVSFSLNIAEPFGLPGPDGPADAKKMLDFYLQFTLSES